MTLVQKTIAASGGDYTSLSLAEASIPNSSTDDFEFTYIEALSDTTPVTFSITSFAGTCVVDVLPAYRCKGAVAGAHAELVYAVNDASGSLSVVSPGLTVRNLRIGREATTNAAAEAVELGASSAAVLDRCTVYGDAIVAAVVRVLGADCVLKGCVVVDRDRASDVTAIIVWFINYTGTSKMYRCSILQSNDTSPGIIRVQGASAVLDARQCVAMLASGAVATNGVWGTSTGTYSASCDANASSGADSPGTNANDSLDPTDVFASVTAASEDLHYPTRAAMLALNAGADVSATTGTADVDGDTIAAWYPGADYVPAPVVAASDRAGPRGHDRDRGTLG